MSPARGAVGFGPGPRFGGAWRAGARGAVGSDRIGSGVEFWWCPGPVGPIGSDPVRGLRAYTNGVSA